MSIAGDKPANAAIMDAALPLESSTRVVKTKGQAQRCAQAMIYMWY